MRPFHSMSAYDRAVCGWHGEQQQASHRAPLAGLEQRVVTQALRPRHVNLLGQVTQLAVVEEVPQDVATRVGRATCGQSSDGVGRLHLLLPP